MVQFGIHGQPEISALWRSNKLQIKGIIYVSLNNDTMSK